MSLEKIKVGDRVWVSARYGGDERGTLKTVARLTPTQIILDGIEKYNRYQRGKPSRYGDKEPQYYGIAGADGRLTFIATTAECEEWDAVKERERLEAEARVSRQQSAEAKRDELTALFSKDPEPNRGTYARDATYGDREFRAGRYDVTLHSLTEEEVRALAERLNVPAPTGN